MVVVVAATTIIDIKCICTTVASQRRVSWYRGVLFYYSIAKFVVVELLLRFVAAFGQRGYGNAAATIVNCRLLPLSLMRCLRRHHHTIHLIYVCMLTDVEMSLKYMKFNMQFMQQLLLLLLLSSVGSLAVAACNNTDLFLLKLYYPSVVVVALNKIFLQFFCEFFVSILCNKKEPTKSTRELRV